MNKVVEHYCDLPQSIRPALWRVWHNVLNLLDSDYSKVFLNYGYASPNGEFDDLVLQDRDEADRYGIQLYQHVTRGVSLRQAAVLEVGCGRGGGASFLARYRKPKEYIGLDISERLVAYCNRFHQIPGLSYLCGTATHLPFAAGRFDAVVNVESARCYGDTSAFFQEVYRVLKPGGFFCFTDMIKEQDLADMHGLLQKPGFHIICQKDIRENVVLALKLDAENRKQLIDAKVPGWLRKSFYEFAGVQGSKRFQSFASGAMQYRSYVLQKQA